MPQKRYYVYINTNQRTTVFYVGITNNIIKRSFEHRQKLVKGFTAKYNVDKLVYYESFNIPQEAIAAEKKIKSWRRAKKIKLIVSKNPEFKNLSEEWQENSHPRDPSVAPE